MAPSPERRKRHHTIPQFVLRNFVDGDGYLFEFDLDLLKKYRRKPAQVGHSTDFYTIQTPDGPSDEIEQILSRIEDAASGAVQKLSIQGQQLSREEWNALVLLVALQRQRVPATRAQMIDFIDRSEQVARRVAQAHGLDPDVATEDLRREMEFTRSGNFMNPYLLDSLKMVYRLMRRRGWAVFRRNADAPPFVLSDNPVVITDLRPDTGPPFTPLIPYGEDSKITMPITPDVMLVSYYDPALSKEAYADAQIVEFLNYQQLQHTERRLYGCDDSFRWGRIGERLLGWPDYVTYQEGARAEQGWKPPHLRA